MITDFAQGRYIDEEVMTNLRPYWKMRSGTVRKLSRGDCLVVWLREPYSPAPGKHDVLHRSIENVIEIRDQQPLGRIRFPLNLSSNSGVGKIALKTVYLKCVWYTSTSNQGMHSVSRATWKMPRSRGRTRNADCKQVDRNCWVREPKRVRDGPLDHQSQYCWCSGLPRGDRGFDSCPRWYFRSILLGEGTLKYHLTRSSHARQPYPLILNESLALSDSSWAVVELQDREWSCKNSVCPLRLG